ncbi:unnamed protein product [Owenia fusiformis]|uniref:RNA polymerase II-associated protein 1 n=1 Tax=Owenia fusiformis TaxID=6347 RepID=A0A8S4P9G1_OWEFU|nr:unnamed protein product [Owenia fusiformis]
MAEKDVVSMPMSSFSSGEGSSVIISGVGLGDSMATTEAKRIHEENVAKIAGMSEEEIKTERAKLEEMLDPKVLAFLKSKRQKSGGVQGIPKPHQPIKKGDEAVPMETNNLDEDTPLIKPKPGWLNMDKVETEKLEWMKNVSNPKSAESQSGGGQARFDFEGHIVASEVPEHLGLHHHGDESNRAGYTLEELFTLARSANLQQRLLALQVVARIMQNAKQCEFEKVLQSPIIPSLLDAGIVFLLRWALDDSVESIIGGAVHAIQALLVNSTDERCYDKMWSWYRGYEMPHLLPSNVAMETEDEEEKDTETDAQLVKKDVIKGFLRMDLLLRLRYILEKCKPTAPVVVSVLQILTRIARHTTESAYKVLNCPRLIKTIVNNFLPFTWKPSDDIVQLSDIYGHPLSCAIKLLRVLSTTGVNMARIIVSEYKILDRISRFIIQETSELQLNTKEAELLCVEAYRLWGHFLAYGLTSEHFRDLYSIFITQLQNVQQLSHDCEGYHLERAVAMIRLLQSSIEVSATHRNLAAKLKNEQKSDEPKEPLPSIDWTHAEGLIQPIESLMSKLMKDFMGHFTIKKYDLSLLSACVNCVATYYAKVANQVTGDTIALLSHIQKVVDDNVVPLLNSHAFSMMLGYLSENSNILSGLTSSQREINPALPELACLCGQDVVVPVLQQKTPYNTFLALLHLVHSLGKIDKSVVPKMFSKILDDKDVLSYTRRVCKIRDGGLVSHWTTRFETYIQFYLAKMANMQVVSDMSVLHQMSLAVFTRLHDNDSHIAHDLLSTVLFNRNFITESQEDSLTSEGLSELTLQKPADITSAASFTTTPTNRATLLEDICQCLPSIRATYMATFGSMAAGLQQSRARAQGLCNEIESFQCGAFNGCLVPRDWMYLPLVDLYQKSTSGQLSDLMENVPPALASHIAGCLRWVYLLECWRPLETASINMAIKISRTMCTFLAGSDLFLEPAVHSYLKALLHEYCKPRVLSHTDFTQPIPGLNAFSDLYLSMLAQYEAVSFGDPLFTCYILLPLQQRHSAQLRKDLWGQHLGAIRSMHVSIHELPVPIENYIMPEETDIELLRLYVQALLSEMVRITWAPVLYLVALHHVNRFMYTQDGKYKQLKKIIMRQVIQLKNKDLKHHLLMYKCVNRDSPHALDLYKELPRIRSHILNSITAGLELDNSTK